jgi:multicomponent Na+:H+ antiporter subunit F
MSEWLHFVAIVLLVSLAGAMWRVWRGPGAADRMMAAQLIGTTGVALMLVVAALGNWAVLLAALTLAILAGLSVVGFVKARSMDGAGDPEETPPPAGLMRAREE